MNILFHTNQLSNRGTDNAILNYAKWHEKINGGTSYIVYNSTSPYNDSQSIEKFNSLFPNRIICYYNFDYVKNIIKEFNIDCIYFIKDGKNDGKYIDNIKNIVHAVFNIYEPHGTKYCYVSEELAIKNKCTFLPHIVELPIIDKTENLRHIFKIPDDAIVFGRHGATNTFNIEFVKKIIKNYKNESKFYFLFLNTEKFTDNSNCIFINETYNKEYLEKFINTCDYMIHAREEGETFGLSCAEFSIQNKPVITYYNKKSDNAHIHMLYDDCLIYENEIDLINIIETIKLDNSFNYKNSSYNGYYRFTPLYKITENVYKKYTPEYVINNFFNPIFLEKNIENSNKINEYTIEKQKNINTSLVISQYNEDFSWTNKLKNQYKIFLYQKLNPNNPLNHPINKGQEASVYLKYIIDNYYNLNEYTIFVHAHETSPHHNGSIADILNNIYGMKTYYYNLNNYKLGYILTNSWIEEIKEWYKEYLEPELGDINLYGDFTYNHMGCGQFLVHKNTILKRSIIFYKNLYNWIITTDLPNNKTSRFMEWTWHLMWEQVPKQIK